MFESATKEVVGSPPTKLENMSQVDSSKGEIPLNMQYGPTLLRWWMLLSVCMVGLLNNSLSGGFNAIANKSAEYFDTTVTGINTLLATVFISILILNFPAQYIVDKYGIKYAMYIGVFFNVLGGWIRFIAKDGGQDSYTTLFIGTVFTSLGSPFVNGLGPSLANAFFPPEERTICVGAVSTLYFIGAGLGVAVGPAFKDDIETYIILQTILQSIQVFFLIGLRNFPSKPPTPLVQTRSEFDFKTAFNHLRQFPSFWMVGIFMGCIQGAFFTVFGLIDQITPFAKEEYSSLVIAISTITGILGTVILGLYNGKHRVYVLTWRQCFVGFILSFFVFCMGIQMESIVVCLLAMPSMGFAVFPLFPIGTEWSIEITWKHGLELEAMNFGVFYEAMSFFSVLLIYATAPDTVGHYKLTVWINAVIFLLCGIGIYFNMNGVLRRKEAEDKGYAEANHCASPTADENNVV